MSMKLRAARRSLSLFAVLCGLVFAALSPTLNAIRTADAPGGFVVLCSTSGPLRVAVAVADAGGDSSGMSDVSCAWCVASLAAAAAASLSQFVFDATGASAVPVTRDAGYASARDHHALPPPRGPPARA